MPVVTMVVDGLLGLWQFAATLPWSSVELLQSAKHVCSCQKFFEKGLGAMLSDPTLLTALGIDGFCCRKRAFGYLATYSVTCFMNFLLFSWYHAFFPGQLRMLKQPNWNLLGLSCCSLCPAEDVDIPVAASMSSLSGTAGKIQVLISLTWSVDLGRRAGCCPHAELDHHNLFQIEYWTIFRCWSSIRFH